MYAAACLFNDKNQFIPSFEIFRPFSWSALGILSAALPVATQKLRAIKSFTDCLKLKLWCAKHRYTCLFKWKSGEVEREKHVVSLGAVEFSILPKKKKLVSIHWEWEVANQHGALTDCCSGDSKNPTLAPIPGVRLNANIRNGSVGLK